MVGELLRSAVNPFKKTELPIRVFEASSNAERVMRYFKLAPYYLSKAADESNKQERLNLIISMAISGLHHSISFKKSFDPVIGETF